MKFVRVPYLVFFLVFNTNECLACQCPGTELSLEESKKYEIIFRGTIVSVVPCGDKFGQAGFEVLELFKGNATRVFTVLFDCKEECAQKLNVGEEWIIYSRYKQIDNAKMEWCSRSRKYFRQQNQDFYQANFGNDYFSELEFLRKNLGQHRLLADKKNDAGNRNKLPDTKQMWIYLAISLGGIIVFYFLFRKWR
jgi:hypothetical protein